MMLKIGVKVVETLVQKEVPCWELPGWRRTGRKLAGSWSRSEVGRDQPLSDASVSLATLAGSLGAVTTTPTICNSKKNRKILM